MIIQCVQCGSDHEAAKRNTTHCNVCRIVRDLAFIGPLTKKCFMCQDKFAPMNRNDNLCAKCDYNHKSYGQGTCVLCKKPDMQLIRMDVSVCTTCARDPEQRRRFVEGAMKKQRKLRENPVRIAELDDAPRV